MHEMIQVVAILAGCGSLVFIIGAAIGYARHREQTRTAAEFHTRLLDRLGSTKDFSDFLNSDGGTRFMDSLALRRETTPQQRILRSISTGIVLTVLGIGLAMLNGEVHDRDFQLVVGFLSAIALSLGIGLLIAAFATEKAARRFGLIDGKSGQNNTRHID